VISTKIKAWIVVRKIRIKTSVLLLPKSNLYVIAMEEMTASCQRSYFRFFFTNQLQGSPSPIRRAHRKLPHKKKTSLLHTTEPKRIYTSNYIAPE
jgi:hypothetical protein